MKKLSFRHYLESQKSSLLTTIHKVGAIFNQVWLSDGNKISCEQSSNLFLILQILPISNVYKGGNLKRTFCYPQFFQKMNKIIRLYYYHSSGRLVSFVFWKNWRHKKRHFEIKWLSDVLQIPPILYVSSCRYLKTKCNLCKCVHQKYFWCNHYEVKAG